MNHLLIRFVSLLNSIFDLNSNWKQKSLNKISLMLKKVCTMLPISKSKSWSQFLNRVLHVAKSKSNMWVELINIFDQWVNTRRISMFGIKQSDPKWKARRKQRRGWLSEWMSAGCNSKAYSFEVFYCLSLNKLFYLSNYASQCWTVRFVLMLITVDNVAFAFVFDSIQFKMLKYYKAIICCHIIINELLRCLSYYSQ